MDVRPVDQGRVGAANARDDSVSRSDMAKTAAKVAVVVAIVIIAIVTHGAILPGIGGAIGVAGQVMMILVAMLILRLVAEKIRKCLSKQTDEFNQKIDDQAPAEMTREVKVVKTHNMNLLAHKLQVVAAVAVMAAGFYQLSTGHDIGGYTFGLGLTLGVGHSLYYAKRTLEKERYLKQRQLQETEQMQVTTNDLVRNAMQHYRRKIHSLSVQF